jgi:hypothetical protein
MLEKFWRKILLKQEASFELKDYMGITDDILLEYLKRFKQLSH